MLIDPAGPLLQPGAELLDLGLNGGRVRLAVGFHVAAENVPFFEVARCRARELLRVACDQAEQLARLECLPPVCAPTLHVALAKAGAVELFRPAAAPQQPAQGRRPSVLARPRAPSDSAASRRT